MKVVFSALLFFSTMALAQNRPEIIFQNQIEIPQREAWVLGDFVQMKNPSPQMMEILEKFAVSSEQVEKGLNAQSVRQIYKKLVLQNPEIAAENPKLVVSQKIDIKKVDGFSTEHFRRKLINVLSSQCVPCDVSILKASIPLKVMAEGQIDWSELKLAASVLIPITSTSEKKQQGQWISVTLKIKKNALVATRNINYGERISAKDFEIKWMDVSYAKEEPLTFEALKNYQVMGQPVLRGRTVFASQLKQEPAAQKGQSVKALMGDDGIEISISAIAEETGRIGDMIKIRNPENKKMMSAIIIEKGVVKIQ